MSKKKKTGRKTGNKSGKKTGKMPEKKNRTAGKTAVFLFSSYMFTFFPLYFHNNYIDIQLAKYHAFVYAAAVFVPLSAMILYWDYLKMKKRRQMAGAVTSSIHNKNKDSTEDLLLFLSSLLLTSMVIAVIRAPWKEDAFTGAISRRMGLITWIFCIAVFLILMKTGETGRRIWYVFAAGSGAVIFIGILNFLGLDPLRMYKNLVKTQHTYFQSTIGNVNFLAGFLCLTAAVHLSFFYCAEKKGDRIFFGTMSVLSIYAGFASVSDTFLIGCFGAYLVFLFVSLEDPRGMKKFWNLCLLFYLSSLLMKLTVINFKGSDPGFIKEFPVKGLIFFVMKPVFLGVTGALLVLFIFFETFFLSKSPGLYPKIRKILFGTAAAAVLVFLIFVMIANSTKLGRKKTSFFRWFYIKESFGSSRGFIWKRSVWTFVKAPLLQKLFGCGPDCLYYAIRPYYGKEMLEKFGSNFTDAHNDFLEMLLTTGIVGTIGYFGILITVLKNGIRNHLESMSAVMSSAMIGTCLCFGIVSNSQIAVTPVFFVLLGLTMIKE